MFVFNRRYDDLEQVAEFLPAFERVLAEIEAAGQYRYNDSFKGRVPGIEGPCEDTAIYLLQGLERQRRQDEKVRALLADGFEHVDRLDDVTRFSRVVLYPTTRTGGEWAEYEGARLVPETRERQAEISGHVQAVLPKGRRTHGTLVMGRRVLVKR